MADLTRNRSSVYTNTAYVYLTSYGNDGKDNLDINYRVYINGRLQYGGYSGSDFNNEPLLLEGLAAGSTYIISVDLDISWTETITWEETVTDDKGNTTTITHTRVEEYNSTDSAACSIYTRPNIFSWKEDGSILLKDDIIQYYITSIKWSALEIHCGQYWSWYAQANNYGLKLEYGVPASGSIITALAFNDMKALANIGYNSYIGVNRGDVIYASLFNDLIATVNDFTV